MLNAKVFHAVKQNKKQILIVTKYWDSEITRSIWNEAQKLYPDSIFGIWENRIELIREKNIPRQHVHFIGNIQSQKIPEIVRRCSVIHSLSSLKHASKIENQWLPISAFIQINLDENKDIWIPGDTLWYFLKACENLKNLNIIWISGMGSADVSQKQKRQEFRTLISLRDTYIPNWLISAGTSRDYDIALEEWVDVVRVWSLAIKK